MRRSSLGHTTDPHASETDEHAGLPEPESEVLMALGAAFLGTLVLGQFVGARSHWEVLVLLGLVAALALIFENLAPKWACKRGRRPGVR